MVALMNLSTEKTIDTTLTVKDTLTNTSEWDINFLTTNLPHITVNRLVAIPAPIETDGRTPLVGMEQTPVQRERDCSIKGNRKSLWSWKGPNII
jgi:hypothetical protein